MATRRIKLEVNKAGDLTSAELQGGAIQAPWQSPRLEATVSTLYSRNVVAMPYGIKTPNMEKEYLDEFNWMPKLQNAFDNLVTSGKPLHLGHFLDRAGTFKYLFFEEAASPLDTTYGYFLHTPSNEINNPAGLFNFFTREFSEQDADPDLRYTLYQNRTVFMKDSKTELKWPVTVQFVGELPAADEEALFDISGEAPVVTFYKPRGIEFRNEAEGSFKVGLCAFSNYLLTWDDNTLYWSNPLDIEDWTPTPAGGGSTRVSAARGNIVSVRAAPNGIHIYCKGNIVYGYYTGVPGNPFQFTEVVGGGGVSTLGGNKLITSDYDTSYAIAFTSAGLQLIQEDKSQLLPDKINKYFSSSTIQTKPDGSCEFEDVTLGMVGGVRRTIVKSLHLSQNLLFVYCAWPVPTESSIESGRLVIYNTDTQAVSFLDGDFPAIARRVDIGSFSNVSPAQSSSKPGLVANQFAVIRRKIADTLTPIPQEE